MREFLHYDTVKFQKFKKFKHFVHNLKDSAGVDIMKTIILIYDL